MKHGTAFAALSSIALLACGSTAEVSSDVNTADAQPSRPEASENTSRDILSYDLQIDLQAREGSVTITVAGDSATGLSLSIGDLSIINVTDSVGPLKTTKTEDRLDIGVPAGGEVRTLTIRYYFHTHTNFDGWLADKQVSFLWPAFCGNLYPCNPDPSDGATFLMNVTGASGTAIYPESIPSDAPSYMPAIAVGDFTEKQLGTTAAGTSVHVWYQDGEEAASLAGTAHLVEVFEFLETTYGAYSFGSKVGTVSANWGGGDFGGMEHHPYWHISSGSMDSERTNAHEAAHGWYGNGVRIACWEDFVLSEGVVTYMAARALEESGVDIWREYECSLKSFCRSSNNTAALLDTCGEIDLINHPLWSTAPYQKGSYFLRQVAVLLGVDVVDAALAEFYEANVGKAARMRDLIALLKSKGQAEAIEELAVAWLEAVACPSTEELCQ